MNVRYFKFDPAITGSSNEVRWDGAQKCVPCEGSNTASNCDKLIRLSKQSQITYNICDPCSIFTLNIDNNVTNVIMAILAGLFLISFIFGRFILD